MFLREQSNERNKGVGGVKQVPRNCYASVQKLREEEERETNAVQAVKFRRSSLVGDNFDFMY